MAPSAVPEVLAGRMRPFRCHVTAAVWRHVLVLVCCTLLAPGRRTVAAALRVMGLAGATGFAVYHRVLSHGHWCSRALAHRLLLLLVAAFVPDGSVTAKLCKMASASGTTQNQRVGLGSVLTAGHALRRTIRYGIAGRPARAPGFPLLDVGDHDRKHVRELGGRFAQLRGHWAYHNPIV